MQPSPVWQNRRRSSNAFTESPPSATKPMVSSLPVSDRILPPELSANSANQPASDDLLNPANHTGLLTNSPASMILPTNQSAPSSTNPPLSGPVVSQFGLKPSSKPPANASSTASTNLVPNPLNSTGNHTIWSPMYASSALRGGSFGAYGAAGASAHPILPRVPSASSSFDSERFRSGGMAWGSAEVPRRRLVSFPSAEPPFPADQPRETGVLDFTVPTVSILERFASLGEATKRAEMRGAVNNSALSPPRQVNGLGSNGLGSNGLGSTGSTGLTGSTGSNPPKAPAAMLAAPPNLPTPQSSAGSPHNSPGMARRSFAVRRKRPESPALELLRQQSDSLALESLLGSIVEASTDQHGSRFIQEHLVSASVATKQAIVAEVAPALLSLATDVFGNYVVQLLFRISDDSDRRQLFGGLRSHVLSLSLQMYGCRVVQVALKHLGPLERRELVEETRHDVEKCIRDHNGNHVMQKAIEFLPSADIAFVYDVLLKNPISFSTHMYGCRVVQRALEHGQPSVQRQLMAVIGSEIEQLVPDQFGNYVVQHVVEHGPPSDREMVFAKLLPRIVKLSEHKYASNVVEKCFIRGTPTQRTQMVDVIVNSAVNGKPAVVAMMKDQYANYVIQRILGTAKDDNYDRLARVVKQNLPLLKRSHYGKHLQAIERRLR